MESASTEERGERVYIPELQKLAITVQIMCLVELSTQGRNFRLIKELLAESPLSEGAGKFRGGSELPIKGQNFRPHANS